MAGYSWLAKLSEIEKLERCEEFGGELPSKYPTKFAEILRTKEEFEAERVRKD